MDNKDVLVDGITNDADTTDMKRKLPSRIVWAATALVFILGIAITFFLFKSGIINPYEKEYIDVTGRTAEDLAAEKDMDYDAFLKEYGLPEDMPKSTFERAVFYNIPVGKIAEKTPGIKSFAELRAQMGWDESVTKDTTMGDALDKTKLIYYVGEEQLERFKTLYELPESVNGETTFGDVRNIVDAKEKEFREADEAAAEKENE